MISKNVNLLIVAEKIHDELVYMIINFKIKAEDENFFLNSHKYLEQFTLLYRAIEKEYFEKQEEFINDVENGRLNIDFNFRVVKKGNYSGQIHYFMESYYRILKLRINYESMVPYIIYMRYDSGEINNFSTKIGARQSLDWETQPYSSRPKGQATNMVSLTNLIKTLKRIDYVNRADLGYTTPDKFKVGDIAVRRLNYKVQVLLIKDIQKNFNDDKNLKNFFYKELTTPDGTFIQGKLYDNEYVARRNLSQSDDLYGPVWRNPFLDVDNYSVKVYQVIDYPLTEQIKTLFTSSAVLRRKDFINYSTLDEPINKSLGSINMIYHRDVVKSEPRIIKDYDTFFVKRGYAHGKHYTFTFEILDVISEGTNIVDIIPTGKTFTKNFPINESIRWAGSTSASSFGGSPIFRPRQNPRKFLDEPSELELEED